METTQKKAEAIRARIAQRHEARLQELKRKKEELAKKSNEKESVSYITRRVYDELQSIRNSLDNTSSIEKGKLVDHFDGLTKSTIALQKFVSDSTMFLPSYDIRHSQDLISEVQAKIDAQRDHYLPKKKFAFRSQKKQVTQGENKKETEETSKMSQDKDIASGPIIERGCVFQDVSEQELTLCKEESTQKDISLSNLEACNVVIYGSPTVMHCKALTDCTISCGPTSRAIFVDDCQNCSFIVACQQLRIHSSVDSKFKIHVTSKAIIEDCTGLGFGKYDFDYPDIQKDYELSGLSQEVNNWDLVDDFDWLKLDEKSPNWYILSNK